MALLAGLCSNASLPDSFVTVSLNCTDIDMYSDQRSDTTCRVPTLRGDTLHVESLP